MNENVFIKIVVKEAHELAEKMLLLSDSKQEAAKLLDSVIDLAIKKIWEAA